MFVEEKTQGEPVRVLDDDARVLFAAADIIDKEGLCKHQAYSLAEDHGPVCLIGGILRAITGSAGGWTGNHPHRQRVIVLAGRVHPGMANWNDHPKRTKDEVVSRIRAVALGL